MSDRDTDPMDKAYAEAEALLDDAAARAARRARVLAAVAETAAEPSPAPRRTMWRHGGWLVAASVAGVSVFIATQIDQRPSFERPIAPPAPQAQAPAPALEAPAQPAAVPPAAAEPAAAPPSAAPPVVMPDAPAPARARPAALDEPPAAREVESIPPLPVPPAPAPAAAAPASPPPPPPPVSSLERRLGRAAAPAPPRADAPAASRKAVIEELVVTGQRVESRSSPAALAEQFREAAASGRTTELARLLVRGVPIDAMDDDGETALMKAVQAKQVDAAALLRRRGASLDLKNNDGRSARDMAAALADPALNRALGLSR